MHLRNIKTSLFIFTLLIAFAACNSNDNKPSDSRNIQLLSDTSAYHNNSASSDSAKMNQANIIRGGNIHHENASGTQSSVANDHNSSSSSNSGNVSNNGSSGSTQAAQKKGWSKAAQGAVIGGAVGAVGGAIISKKKGTGAAIGAVAGAAGGYIIGRDKDKKDGRVKK